ncbi:transposon ty3-I gag-pol polyprotein [Tanacetum coccineum]|uniref:Transposon ty3-I gag-pol polyprotein n=1 Tax=Tanacetum coccineum TaxID=301880 RepID=A0ABQ4X9Y3_9ASTR
MSPFAIVTMGPTHPDAYARHNAISSGSNKRRAWCSLLAIGAIVTRHTHGTNRHTPWSKCGQKLGEVIVVDLRVRGRRNGRPQRQPFQQHNYGGEDSDVENEYEDEREVRGMRFGHRGAADFDYRQRAKDVPTFYGSMNGEDFLDWMTELDTFFKFYEIPMDNRVNLVAYKLKGDAQSWWKNLQTVRERQGKLPIVSWERMERELRRRFLPPNHDKILFNLLQNCAQGKRSMEVYTAEFHRLSSRNDLSEIESQQVTRYINGLRPEIQDRISLVPVYTLDDAYNLAIRAENQLAKNNRSTLFPSTNRNKFVSNAGQSTSKPEGSDTNSYARPEKSSSTNPYARHVIGKCFKCGAPGHRSSEYRATGGKINLTTREDDYDEGEEERFDEEIETDVCHLADELDGNLYANDEYSSRLCVIRRIMLAPKLVEKYQQHNLYRTRCVIHQRVFDVIIDSGSTENIISRDCTTIEDTYRKTFKPVLYWLDQICWRNQVDMDACHILLGRPWEYDVNAIYKGKENNYSFIINGVMKVLVPLIDKNKSKDFEATRNNMMILNHGDFNDQIKGESVIYVVVEIGTIQEGSSIPKKLLPLMDEFKSLVPDELPSTLPPMRSIQHQIDLVP